MIAASVVVPLLVFAAGSWLAWRDTVEEANANLRGALAVSSEQVTRVLDTHVLLGSRISDVLSDLSDADVTAHEQELHERLVAMIAGYSQVTAVVVVDADGRALVASSRYPVDRGDQIQRPRLFQALRDTGKPFEIGGVVFGRLTRAGSVHRRGSSW